MDWLVKTIESEIIPRLMATYQAETERENVGGSPSIRAREILDFTDIALQQETAACRQYIDSIQRRGVPLHSIYLDLLTPAARRLDHLWTQDHCDFTQITIAMWRMQQVMYDLSPMFQLGQQPVRGKSHAIMLMPVPGSQHTLGILMVAEFFRRAGWSVWGEPTATRERLLEAARQDAFAMAGISIGSEVHVDELNDFIGDLRHHSKNRTLHVIVGGPLLHHEPELRRTICADSFSTDAQQAVAQAERLMADRLDSHAPK